MAPIIAYESFNHTFTKVSTTLSAMKKKQGTEIELEFLVAPKLSEVQQYGRDLADRVIETVLSCWP